MRQKGVQESGSRYETLNELNLSTNIDLTAEIQKLAQKSWGRIAISERVITINELNFSFHNGNKWGLLSQQAEEVGEDVPDVNFFSEDDQARV